jgi:hypothetical protein
MPNSEVWSATFEHLHDDKGVVHEDPRKKDPVLVKHVTRCKLSRKGNGFSVIGVALCSLRDEYDWRYGIKNSLQRALAAAGLCEEITEKEGRLHIQSNKHYKQHDFMPLKPEYQIAIKSFFDELPIKDYAPHIRIGEVVDGSIPPQNMTGLAYTGMD